MGMQAAADATPCLLQPWVYICCFEYRALNFGYVTREDIWTADNHLLSAGRKHFLNFSDSAGLNLDVTCVTHSTAMQRDKAAQGNTLQWNMKYAATYPNAILLYGSTNDVCVVQKPAAYLHFWRYSSDLGGRFEFPVRLPSALINSLHSILSEPIPYCGDVRKDTG